MQQSKKEKKRSRPPKYKLDRSIGVNILGRPKSAIQARNFLPGEHGHKKQKKRSEYCLRLKECAKLRRMYGRIRFKKLKQVVADSLREPGRNDDNIARKLESTLANVVYDAKFAITPEAAKQLVSHGHVCVNGKKTTIKSYRVKVNDTVSIREKMWHNTHVQTWVKSKEREIPEWMCVVGNTCTVSAESHAHAKKFQRTQTNFNLIIEHISARI